MSVTEVILHSNLYAYICMTTEHTTMELPKCCAYPKSEQLNKCNERAQRASSRIRPDF